MKNLTIRDRKEGNDEGNWTHIIELIKWQIVR